MISETPNLKRSGSGFFDQKMLPLKKRKFSLENETQSWNFSHLSNNAQTYLNGSSLLKSNFSDRSDTSSTGYSSDLQSCDPGSPIECSPVGSPKEVPQSCQTPPAPVQVLKTVPLFPQLAKLLTTPMTPQGQPNIICIISSRPPAAVQNYR